MNLKIGHILKHGECRVENVLGQGGFGITYLCEQTALQRKVAIKEFFMKEICNRDADTSQVSIPSIGSRVMVERFRRKFIKEARTLAAFNHKHIVRIIDVFEENNTAYYVMEYVGGGSLKDKIREGALPEKSALRYIRQVATALEFVHSQQMMHLDIKPSNILLNENDEAVLIDFGLAKQYDAAGSQTSTTPVGISPGYSPLEQYRQGGVETFSPATDIYSLGATLYKLLTGVTPPEAGDVKDGDFSVLSQDISAPVRATVKAAMQLRREDRPQSIGEFLKLLDGDGNVKTGNIKDETSDDGMTVFGRHDENDKPLPPIPNDKKHPHAKKLTAIIVLAFLCIVAVVFFVFGGNNKKEIDNTTNTNTINGHEYVDLGLPSGLLWATCNVGAMTPWDYGGYYAWGETDKKNDYSLKTYKWYDDSCDIVTKYCIDEDDGIHDNKIILDPEDDVAHVKWGGSWRMPTQAEQDELRENCTWTWTIQNEVAGCIVTGPNGNSIFLPAAGYYAKNEINDRDSFGRYWSSWLECNADDAYNLDFSDDEPDWDSDDRCYGLSVRPVSGGVDELTEQERLAKETAKQKDAPIHGTINGHEYVDLGLSSGLLWATCNVGANTPSESGDYYSWGETEKKDEYSLKTYKWFKDSCEIVTKYCTDKDFGTLDNKIVLDLRDDVAHVKWGGSWRIPTLNEQKELLENCSWTWINKNGICGYNVTGPNGNSIFLPAAGGEFDDDDEFEEEVESGVGLYWSSWLECDDNGATAYILYIDDKSYECGEEIFREVGASVRPVSGVSSLRYADKLAELQRIEAERIAKKAERLAAEQKSQEEYAITHGAINGHEYVDLGLSVKWATCNVGASTPGDYGNYYAWDETTTKSNYTESNSTTYGKHMNSIADNGSYDVARKEWGSSWRIPTEGEFYELIDNCTWTWTTQNGHNGYKVTSKKNGNSIFLPAAGWRDGASSDHQGGYGSYWSATLDESDAGRAYGLGFYDGDSYVFWDDRACGRTVRPVCE